MPTNPSRTRRARIYATDLAIGDVIVTITGDYVGAVDSVPDINRADDAVTFHMNTGGAVTVTTYRTNKVVRIEIGRATS